MIELPAQTIIFKASLPIVPPGVNKSYQIIKHTNKQTGKESRTLGDTPEEKQFKNDVYYLMVEARNSNASFNYATVRALQQSKVPVPLELTLHFYFQDIWERDEDGGIKAMQDSLFDFLQLNDKLVTELHVKKLQTTTTPHTDIELRSIAL